MERFHVKLILFAAVGLVVIVLSFFMIESNSAGVFTINQQISGNIQVITTAGPFYQGFGSVTSYNQSQVIDAEGAERIKVRFADGGTALVSGSVQFILPPDQEMLAKLHTMYRSEDTLRSRALHQLYIEAIQQTASLMKSEESYSTRRTEFVTLVEEQLKKGIFITKAIEVKEKDVDGNEFNDTNIVISRDDKGQALIGKKSPLPEYGIIVGQLVIKDFDYDETIDSLIQKKKEAEQQKVVARANAEKAKQDAITARERATAEVAVAKGQEEVEKIKAITQAEKEREVGNLRAKKEAEVAIQQAEKEKKVALLQSEKELKSAEYAKQSAELLAQAKLAQGKADAEVNKMKVSSGLTPQEAAEYKMKTDIGVAQALATVKVPTFVMGGGTGGSSTLDLIGIKSLLEIQKQMGGNK